MTDIDIRTRLIISSLFSAMALLYQDICHLAFILIFNIITLFLFGIRAGTLKGIKKLLYISATMILLQSVFVRTGHPIFRLGETVILTYDGVSLGVSVFLRFLILMLSGLFILNSNISQLTRGLVKLGMPYEIAFMIQLGARFIPVLAEEIGEILNSVQLRGVDLKKVYKRKIIRVYISIFLPIVYSIWQKAEKLSVLLEMRGFRMSSERTYYREIQFKRRDYVIICLYIFLAGVFIYKTR